MRKRFLKIPGFSTTSCWPRGELTGHAHRIAERDAAELHQSSRGLFLRVKGDRATLVHQEHAPIALPRGVYRVWRQREYSPAEIRVVRD